MTTAAEPEVIDVESRPSESEPTVASLVPAVRPTSALVRPAADLDDIESAFKAYQDVSQKLIGDSDRQKIGDKFFTKRSGWRKLAVAFGVSFEIGRWEHTRDDDGRIIRSEFLVRAIAPNGRSADGYGACSVYDRCESHYATGKWPCKENCTKHCGGRDGGCTGFRHFSKPEHDIPATAETRAKNRAAADLFGMGEVSAEEVDRHDPETALADWDEVKLIIEAGKALKAAGGDPQGPWPKVYGTPVIERYTAPDENGDDKQYEKVLVSKATAGDLLARLRSELQLVENASGNEGAAEAPPESVPAGPIPAGDDHVPNPALGADVEPAGVEQTEAGASEPAPQTPVSAAPKDDEPAEVKSKDLEDSQPGQRSNYAQRCRALFAADPPVFVRDEQHDIIEIITNGRSRSSTHATFGEMNMAIKAVKLVAAGHLAVRDVAGGVGRTIVALGDDNDPTPPEATPGMVFIRELTAFLAAQPVRP